MGTVVQGTGSGPDAGTVLSAVPGDALTHLISLHVMLASIETADVVRARVALERESTRLAAKHAARPIYATRRGTWPRWTIRPSRWTSSTIWTRRFTSRSLGHPATCWSTELTTALRTAMRPTLLTAFRPPRLPGGRGAAGDEHRDPRRDPRGDGELAARRIEAHIDGFYSGRSNSLVR